MAGIDGRERERLAPSLQAIPVRERGEGPSDRVANLGGANPAIPIIERGEEDGIGVDGLDRRAVGDPPSRVEVGGEQQISSSRDLELVTPAVARKASGR